MRIIIDDLKRCLPPIGLIVCDEGHRLKSSGIKTSTVFNALETRKRIILSGTPIQNDLSEFHSMADFCNPGLLDEYSTFRKAYEIPILRSREPNCSGKEKELGELRTKQLMSIARNFVLRRDANILSNYLPPKYEFVVFITPTSLQAALFSKMLGRDNVEILVDSQKTEALAVISALTKISTSPALLRSTMDKDPSSKGAYIRDAVERIPSNIDVDDMSLSGKMIIVSRLLTSIYRNTEEKCVLVSHYTSTLNILEEHCKAMKYSYFRLDGQTPGPKRQEYVNTFNKSSQKAGFVFLLSAKAGGVGINLIGASRLCLIDTDWNPSHDLQSMARCHRDGQTRPVFIYRLLTVGTIDEKIFQRQITKLGLSNSLMGGSKNSSTASKTDTFSRQELQEIFCFHSDTACHTHDLLGCTCDNVTYDQQPIGNSALDEEEPRNLGFVPASKVKLNNEENKAYLEKKRDQLAMLDQWQHINCLWVSMQDTVKDNILRSLLYSKRPEPAKALSLVDQLDLERIQSMGNMVPISSVPGGTISFIFHKSSLGNNNGE